MALLLIGVLFAVPPHALTMHILNPDIAITGDSLTLSLSAVKTSGFSNDPIISCMNQNKTSLSELEDFDYPDNPSAVGLTLNIQVPITHIKLSHAGVYFCTAILVMPNLLDNISDSANTTIIVKSEFSVFFLSLFQLNTICINCISTPSNYFFEQLNENFKTSNWRNSSLQLQLCNKQFLLGHSCSCCVYLDLKRLSHQIKRSPQNLKK